MIIFLFYTVHLFNRWHFNFTIITVTKCLFCMYIIVYNNCCRSAKFLKPLGLILYSRTISFIVWKMSTTVSNSPRCWHSPEVLNCLMLLNIKLATHFHFKPLFLQLRIHYHIYDLWCFVFQFEKCYINKMRCCVLTFFFCPLLSASQPSSLMAALLALLGSLVSSPLTWQRPGCRIRDKVSRSTRACKYF